jgi:hypothetical protein
VCKYGVDVEAAADRANACKSHVSGQVRKLHANRIACEALQHFTLSRYITHVHPTHVDAMRFKIARPFLCSGAPTRGIELLIRVRMSCLWAHERTRQYGGSRADSNTACPACGQGVESLSHLMFDCPATSVQRDAMFDEIRSVLRDVRGGAERLRNVLSLTDASTKLLRFVSDDVWGSRGVCRVISRSIAEHLV